MSGWMSSDQDPDVLHLESKKITFSHVKEALRERFRLEEIARLGNIHLIYPALNSHYFKEFINKELNVIYLQFKKVFGVDVCISEPVKQMLFEEGVTPSQGVRPLRSSIRFLLESPLANLLSETHFNLENRILVCLDEDELVLEQKNEVISKKKLFLPVKEARRKKLDSQSMAITAVHEAGHTLVYVVLFGRLPKVVTIASSDHYVGGLISGESIVNFENLDFILRDAAVRLAGKKAEELVFGSKQNTTGASSDLQKATNVLIELSRSGTVSESFVAYESKLHGSGSLLPDSEREWKWVEEQLDNASVLSEKIIVRNMGVFQLLIKVLLEEKHLTSKKLCNILLDNGIDLVALMNSHPPLFDYLERLNKFFVTNPENLLNGSLKRNEEWENEK